MAGGEGFEPPLAESQSAVLPLDDPPVAGQPDYITRTPKNGEGLAPRSVHGPSYTGLRFPLSSGAFPIVVARFEKPQARRTAE